ncbi:hypothetical protein LguiA_007914 [Lonicera macranthoides]
MALLLGPPSSGKTTILLAPAGKLDPSLKVRGEITYNGHGLKEFVPQKTSAYISQNDVHVGEMTVKETLDFLARCQGVGSRYELLTKLEQREKNARIFPEAEVDLFMKATAMDGVESSLITDYTLRKLLEDPLLPKKYETNAIVYSINRASKFDPELVSCSKPLNLEKPKRNISSLDFEDENENEKPKGNIREKKVDADVTKRTHRSISLLRLLTDNLHL